MNPHRDRIEELGEELIDVYYGPSSKRARRVAEELAALLEESADDDPYRYIHFWVLIWEVRGNWEEAIRLEDRDIIRQRAELDSGDFDPYPRLRAEYVEILQDCYYFQAERYEKISERCKAIECLREVYDLARQYEIGPDKDAQSLYMKIMASETHDG